MDRESMSAHMKFSSEVHDAGMLPPTLHAWTRLGRLQAQHSGERDSAAEFTTLYCDESRSGQ